MTDEEIRQRREAIKWVQETGHPHGCGDRGPGPGCPQNLDGTCDRKTCDYYGLKAAE